MLKNCLRLHTSVFIIRCVLLEGYLAVVSFRELVASFPGSHLPASCAFHKQNAKKARKQEPMQQRG